MITRKTAVYNLDHTECGILWVGQQEAKCIYMRTTILEMCTECGILLCHINIKRDNIWLKRMLYQNEVDNEAILSEDEPSQKYDQKMHAD